MVLPLLRAAGVLRGMLLMDMTAARPAHQQPVPDQPVDVPLRLPVQDSPPFVKLIKAVGYPPRKT